MTGPAQTEWHGTGDEGAELNSAIQHNCGCTYGPTGERAETCAAHQMMVSEQRCLDGLLAMRHMADRLRREEWTTEPKPEGGSA